MPITPEQRQVLLDRLKLARIAKDKKKAETQAQKAQAPAPKAQKAQSQPAPIEIPFEVPLPSEPIVAPKAQMPKAQEIPFEEPLPPAPKAQAHKVPVGKQKKDAYAKIVFYKEPSRKKMDTLMKSLHEETSSSEEEDEYVLPPVREQQRTQRLAVPTGARHLPQVNDRTEFMRQLARSYYN
jgi:hypothetical protein